MWEAEQWVEIEYPRLPALKSGLKFYSINLSKQLTCHAQDRRRRGRLAAIVCTRI